MYRPPQPARAVSEATSSIQRVWFRGGTIMARSYRKFAAYSFTAWHEVNLGTARRRAGADRETSAEGSPRALELALRLALMLHPSQHRACVNAGGFLDGPG